MKKVAAAFSLMEKGTKKERKADGKQTEVKLTKQDKCGVMGRRMNYLTKRKFPSTADGSVSDGRTIGKKTTQNRVIFVCKWQ